MSSQIKERILADVKDAMRARDKERLGVLRLVSAAIKQREVDSRQVLDDTEVMQILDKMVKQRRDSESQYRDAGRSELAEQEAYEVTVIAGYLPQPLSQTDLAALVDAAISKSGAKTMQDMGKVMGALKPQVQGRADMAAVSAAVKAKLTA